MICYVQQIIYQIFTYVKNKQEELKDRQVTVSGMLLYAKTDEQIVPDNTYQMSGNQISVKTLDLNCGFDEIREQLEVLPEEQRKDSTAAIGLDYCGKLYAIEKKMKDESPEDRLKERQEQAKPLLDAFFVWAKSLRNIAPKSKLGKAVNYLIEEEPYLRRYIEDGRLEIDNNRAERSIKPFVIVTVK